MASARVAAGSATFRQVTEKKIHYFD